MEVIDKVVWITGASSGIGRAVAKECISRGSKVIASARNEEKLKELVAEIGNQDVIRVLPLDLEKHDELPSKVQEAVSIWGHVDILVNNGGISQRSLLEETNVDVIKKIINVNFLGTAILSREIIQSMKEQGEGFILMVSSVAGKFSTPLRTIYSASKMALQGLCDGLRAELWSHNIKVALVVPGFVKTDISINALEGQGNKHGVMDPNQAGGISPEKAAAVILKGIKRNRHEIFMGLVFKTRLALFLARFFPGILARMLRRAKVT